MHSQLYFPLRHLPASCTWLPSIPAHFTSWNTTMMFTTKSYSQYLKLSPNGNIISRVLVHPLTLSLTAGTSSTFPQPRSSHVTRQDGLNTFPGSTGPPCHSLPSWEARDKT